MDRITYDRIRVSAKMQYQEYKEKWEAQFEGQLEGETPWPLTKPAEVEAEAEDLIQSLRGILPPLA